MMRKEKAPASGGAPAGAKAEIADQIIITASSILSHFLLLWQDRKE